VQRQLNGMIDTQQNSLSEPSTSSSLGIALCNSSRVNVICTCWSLLQTPGVIVGLQVVNCVGLMNYKFFLQFLIYTFVATSVAIACLIQPMLTFFSGNPGGR
jgi:hypothetical protein